MKKIFLVFILLSTLTTSCVSITVHQDCKCKKENLQKDSTNIEQSPSYWF